MFPDLNSRYPQETLRERDRAKQFGTFREKVRFDLVPRPNYAFGLLAAADIARFCGIQKLTAIECGVAEGYGLLNLCEVARMVTQETGVQFDIIGFDTGQGLPTINDYRDHPEIWTEGDFPTTDRDALMDRLPENADIIWGDVKDTIPAFMNLLNKDAPVGFVSMDVDIYRSTKDALALFLGAPELCLPVTVTYFDDTLGSPQRMGSLFRNRWSGQLLAIDEFNAENKTRKLDIIRTLKFRRPLEKEQWLDQIYALHVLDHPLRSQSGREDALRIQAHGEDQRMHWPL